MILFRHNFVFRKTTAGLCAFQRFQPFPFTIGRHQCNALHLMAGGRLDFHIFIPANTAAKNILSVFRTRGGSSVAHIKLMAGGRLRDSDAGLAAADALQMNHPGLCAGRCIHTDALHFVAQFINLFRFHQLTADIAVKPGFAIRFTQRRFHLHLRIVMPACSRHFIVFFLHRGTAIAAHQVIPSRFAAGGALHQNSIAIGMIAGSAGTCSQAQHHHQHHRKHNRFDYMSFVVFHNYTLQTTKKAKDVIILYRNAAYVKHFQPYMIAEIAAKGTKRTIFFPSDQLSQQSFTAFPNIPECDIKSVGIPGV